MRRLTIAVIAVMMLALVAWMAGKPISLAANGPARASGLAQAWSRHVGVPDRDLGPTGDLSLGDTGLVYDATRNVLLGRVYVTMALTKGAADSEIATLRRMTGALNDPAIGGMYDRGGGHFVLDEAREGYYLTRSFPVPATTPQSLIHDMDRMREVAPTWTTRWFLDVAMVMHGKEKPPIRRQTVGL